MKKRCLKVVGGLAVAVMLLNLVLVPSAQARVTEPWDEPLPGREERQGCGCGKSCTNHGHFLEGITIERSEEVTGGQRDRLVTAVLNSPDVQNVIQQSRVKPDDSKARVMVHTLDTGDTLLAVGFPIESGVLIYYRLVGTEERYSQAMFITIEGETAEVASKSMNGHLIPSPSRQPGATLGSVHPNLDCGWLCEYCDCTHYDVQCITRCCGSCVVPCMIPGNTTACVLCALLWCPLCASTCCDSWHCYCAECPAP